MFGVSSISVVEDLALVSLHKLAFPLEIIADIFTKFSQAGINIDMISQALPVGGNTSISFTCPDADIVKVLEIAKKLSSSTPELKPMVSSGNCKIQLYGIEMPTTCGVFSTAITALATTDTQLQQIATSDVDISLLVSNAHCNDAVNALKTAFCI